MTHYYKEHKSACDLLFSRGLPENVIKHCCAVADTCGAMAEALNAKGFALDVGLCVRAGLLHDVDRLSRDHAKTGAELLMEKGFERESEIVRCHMGVDIDYTAITEKELVYLADKITQEHHRTTVANRYAPALEMTLHKPEVNAHIESVMKDTQAMARLYEKHIGYSLQELPIGRTRPMLIRWNDMTIKWMADAEAYSGYYSALAKLIEKETGSGVTIAEPGSGAGFLTRELAKFAKQVTAVEIDERAVREINSLRLSNVTGICSDAADTFIEADCAVYSFYGGAEEIANAVRSGRYKKVIAIGSAKNKHNFSTDTTGRRRCFSQMLEHLEEKGIKYTLALHELDFSQPVADTNEAIRFSEYYGGMKSEEEILAKLEKCEKGPWGYVIPAVRYIGFAVMEGMIEQ
ncbi:MAG: HDIG domain-containing protein [Oscillospiraceae bacterium]|nr:HDIG domain-containing protein [Oscillospiraceae bacterium]